MAKGERYCVFMDHIHDDQHSIEIQFVGKNGKLLDWVEIRDTKKTILRVKELVRLANERLKEKHK